MSAIAFISASVSIARMELSATGQWWEICLLNLAVNREFTQGFTWVNDGTFIMHRTVKLCRWGLADGVHGHAIMQ